MPDNRFSLTGQQILDLAEFAGFAVAPESADDTMRDTEYTITTGEAAWLEDDSGRRCEFEAIVHTSDYPEDGCVGLGPELQKPAALAQAVQS